MCNLRDQIRGSRACFTEQLVGQVGCCIDRTVTALRIDAKIWRPQNGCLAEPSSFQISHASKKISDYSPLLCIVPSDRYGSLNITLSAEQRVKSLSRISPTCPSTQHQYPVNTTDHSCLNPAESPSGMRFQMISKKVENENRDMRAQERGYVGGSTT